MTKIKIHEKNIPTLLFPWISSSERSSTSITGDSLRGPEVTSPSNTNVLYKLSLTTYTRAPLNICSSYPPLYSVQHSGIIALPADSVIDCSNGLIVNKSTEATTSRLQNTLKHWKIKGFLITRYYIHENGLQPFYPKTQESLKMQFKQP